MQHLLLPTLAILFVASAAWLYSLIRTREAALSLHLEAKNYQETMPTPWGAYDYPGSTRGTFISLVRQRSRALGITGPIELDAPVPDVMKQSVTYVGVTHLPRKVYVDDSLPISVTLREGSFYHKQPPDESMPNALSIERRFSLLLVRGVGVESFLEVEIQAAGFKIDGEKTQRQSLRENMLTFSWSCAFPTSGRHTLTLWFKAVGPSWNSQVHKLEHTFKVVQFDHFTKREVQVYIFPIAAVLGAVFTLLQVLRLLGYV